MFAGMFFLNNVENNNSDAASMLCNGLRAWWLGLSRLAALLPYLVARRGVKSRAWQELRLVFLSWVGCVSVLSFAGPAAVRLLDMCCSGVSVMVSLLGARFASSRS